MNLQISTYLLEPKVMLLSPTDVNEIKFHEKVYENRKLIIMQWFSLRMWGKCSAIIGVSLSDEMLQQGRKANTTKDMLQRIYNGLQHHRLQMKWELTEILTAERCRTERRCYRKSMKWNTFALCWSFLKLISISSNSNEYFWKTSWRV